MKREMISQKPHKRSISGLGKHLDLSSGTSPFQRTVSVCTFSHLIFSHSHLLLIAELSGSKHISEKLRNMEIDVYFTIYNYKNGKLEVVC